MDVVANGCALCELQDEGYLITLLGKGNGAFKKPAYRDVKGEVYQYLAADFNGDGNTDLVTSDVTGGGVDIYLGSGKGTFQPRVSFGAGDAIGKIATGFLRNQGVGYADIVGTSVAPNITVFLNQMTSK